MKSKISIYISRLANDLIETYNKKMTKLSE